MLAILHGSRATGNTHYNSDWDVAVLADHALNADDRAVLRRSFAAKLRVPDDRVDIADLHSDAPVLRYRAAMDGKLVEGDPLEFRKFQITAWKDYLNNEKMFDLRSRFVRKALSSKP